MAIDTAKALIIAHSSHLSEELVRLLQIAHYEPVIIPASAAMLEQCRLHQPALVFLDLTPHGDNLLIEIGGELLAELALTFPELPAVVVDGDCSPAEVARYFKLGAWDFLVKPITSQALTATLTQAQGRKEQLRQANQYRRQLEENNQKLQASLQKLREDEEAGRRLQFQLLPKNDQTYSGYRFNRYIFTSLYLSGDFADYFYIDDEHIGFYIADVSGHGLPSAFVTVLLKSYMSRYIELHRQGKSAGILNPAKILTRLNHNILGGEMGKYLTMFYGVINTTDNTLLYSNGGQFPLPLMWNENSSQFIGEKSLPVGLFDFAEYSNLQLQLPHRFSMLLMSDGLLEVLEQPKLQAKLAYLQASVDRKDIEIETLIQRLGLTKIHTPPDDITLLSIRKGH